MRLTVLSSINVILISVGIAYLHGHKNERYTLKFIWQLFNVIIYGAILIPEVAFIVVNMNDPVKFSEGVLINVTFSMFFVKLVCHFIHRNELKDIVDALLLDDLEKGIPLIAYMRKTGRVGKRAKELDDLINSSERTLLRIIKHCLLWLGGPGFSTIALFSIFPIILGFKDPVNHHRELPLTFLLPWDDKKTPNYQITYVFHLYFGIMCVSAYVGVDCLVAMLMGELVRQLKVLAFVTSHLGELVAEVRGGEDERDCTTLLAGCAVQYVRLKRYCTRLNEIHKPYFIVQALFTSGLICLCMFMIATSKDKLTAQNVRYLTYEMTAIIQIGLYCAVGQQLTDESEKLHWCVTGSWWRRGRRHRSCLRIFQAAVQQPLVLYIWGSVDLSHATFGTIVKTSVSYFTLLLSVADKEIV